MIGREHYDRLLGPTRGAIVVGAHLGSFDALRALAERDRRTVNVLMYTEHAPRINAVFRALSPDVQLRVIQVERDSMGTVLQIRSCIERGEIVAMLGDRVEPADRGRTCAVTLLGGRIEVPEAPYLLAGLLGCPLFFMVALRAPGPRYRVFAEVLAERVDFGRGRARQADPRARGGLRGPPRALPAASALPMVQLLRRVGGGRAMNRRVVVTGMSGIAPIGSGWKEVRESLQAGRSGVVRMDAWDGIAGLQTRVAAPVPSFEAPDDWPRRKTRSMGRDSLLATRATELALADAGLLGHPALGDGRTGVAYGCTQGSPRALEVYARQFYGKQTTSGIRGSDFIRFMSHTCAANIAQFFGLRGRIIPTTSACTSGSQGIGYAYEAIRFGRQDVMIAGGAEEIDGIDAAIFDILLAASTRNDEPTRTPRPFDAARDGVVVAEGAGSLVLEELEFARARGARIVAEVLGYGTNCDGLHMTNPSPEGMEQVMRLALADAGLDARRDRLRERARHGHRGGRHRREPGHAARVRAARARLHAEGPHGAHARRVRRARGLDQPRDGARGLGRADAATSRSSTRAARRSTT